MLFVPLVAIAYFSCEMFKGTEAQEEMVTDSINTMMPEPAGDGLHNKFAAMEDNLLKIWKGKVKIVFSELKESDAAILGASALAWEL